MRKMKTAILLLMFAAVATLAFPALGGDPKTLPPAVKFEATNGGGSINSTVMTNNSTFGFEAINVTIKNSIVQGNLQYDDHGAHIKLHGNVTTLAVNKTAMPATATFSGTATATNATGAKFSVPYTVDVTAGKKDTGIFNITIPAIPAFLPAGYTDNGTLIGGQIKVDP